MKTEIRIEDWYHLLWEYSLIFVILGIIVMLTGWFTIMSNVKIYIKLIIIPLLFSLFCVIMFYVNDILGYAYPAVPNNQVIYIGAKRLNDTVEVWVWPINDKYTRLYRIPYSKELMKMLIGLDKKSELTNKQFVLDWNGIQEEHGSKIPKVIDLIDLDYFNKDKGKYDEYRY